MKILTGLFFLLFTFSLSAQIEERVTFQTEVKKLDDENLLLLVKAKLDTGWHIYSQPLLIQF